MRAYLPFLGIGLGVVVALLMARKLDLLPNASEVFADIGTGAVDAANGILRGTVESVGQVVGVPKTNMTQCQKDIRAGDMWAASFSCPAKDFLGAAWDRL